MSAIESLRAVFCGIDNVVVETTRFNAPADGELLVRNKASFVCATDLKIIKNGYFRIKEGERRVLGHEVSGVVEMVGPSVENYQEGDAVLIAPNLGCGSCELCRAGYEHLCAEYEAIGITLDGGFAQHTLVPQRFIRAGNVIRLPQGYNFDQAALIEPASCCLNAHERIQPRPGDKALVIGAGPIGAFHTLLLKAARLESVFICDLVQERLEKLSFLAGVERFCNKDRDLLEYSRQATAGRMFDIVIVANASPQCQQIALKVAGIRGRVNFFGGIPKNAGEVPLDTNQIHYKELTVIGTTRSKLAHFHEVIRLLAETGMTGHLDRWVSAKYTLNRFPDACKAAMQPGNLKVGFSLD
jgi:threonine dehydrogenase-like Zn-dependent dehydrogenase